MKRLLVCAFVLSMLPGCPTFLANRPAASTEPDGPAEMTLAAYAAQRPADPVTLTVDCAMDSMYVGSWRNASKTHYAVSLRQRLNVFAGFAAMESQVGRDLFDVLKDGKEHRLKVTLHLIDKDGAPITDRSLGVCTITAVATAR